MPNFVLDARTATPHFPGIGRYVSNLARALVPLLTPDERLTVICDPAHLVELPSSEAVQTIPLAVSPFSLRQQWAIPRLLHKVDRIAALRPLRTETPPPRFVPHPSSLILHPSDVVYHSPYIAMPFFPGVPALLTVYDLIPLRYPEHSTPHARRLIRWMNWLALRIARHVIAISDFTRQDYLAEFDIAPQRITTIPLAPDPAFRPQTIEAVRAVRQKYALPERFALYLGSNKPHKNLVRLVEAWRIASQRMANPTGRLRAQRMMDGVLVIAGAWDDRYPEARQSAEALTPATPDTRCELPASSFQPPIWLGPLPETDLPALYAAASVFVFPSLYEGFGLPVLEAMACGTPVVCSNTSSLPEVAGDAALLIDPVDVSSLAEGIAKVLTDPDLAALLKQRGLSQAKRFSWQVTAQRTLVCYRSLLVGQNRR